MCVAEKRSIFATDMTGVKSLKIVALGMCALLIFSDSSAVQAGEECRDLGQTAVSVDMGALKAWRAGETVTAEAVAAYGIKNCFAAEPIPDAIWAKMQGKTYRQNPYIGRGDLRHIRVLHWDYDNRIHIGEMICNQAIAADLVTIFRRLYDAKYPIQRMVLPDVYDGEDERQMRANNSSCFCYRVVSGTKVLSKHSKGMAVDLNPLYNPYYKVKANGTIFVQPATAEAYCNRSKNFKYKIDKNDLAYKLFKAYGFKWGGDWKSTKDFQHFEK